MREITELTALELSRALEAGTVTATAATEAYLQRIDEKNAAIGAYLTVNYEGARKSAAQSDKRRARGEARSPLDGVPVGVKDNICTLGIRTTCASRMLENYVPPFSATVMEKLEAAGAVILGKLNMDEFAMGSSTENSAFCKTHNPVDAQRVPGGSSGGSAAAVTAGMAAFALGSDTGGSIRQPAAFCGAVGLKPTYGRVSRYGLVAFASSLDQIGPLARNVRDCAAALQLIAGHDRRDSTSAPHGAPDFSKELAGGVEGMKIALAEEFLSDGVAPDVRAAVEHAAGLCEKGGATVNVISMPSLKSALPTYYVISSAEASSNLARFDGVRYGSRAARFAGMEELYRNTRSEFFGPEVKRRIMLGTFALSAGYYDAYYKRALQVRTLIMEEFERIFKTYDLVMSPTSPVTAWRFGEKSDPMEMYLADICTVPANIVGIPALSLPCGLDKNGLPIGLQLMGRHFDEGGVLRAACALETALGGKQG
ncbi:MAG: Asp-tRNA(Asn)/Glu-tRNA(Gln) amidotransferase subunit GatA [Candidatus Pelethousia sp.]|nr:Asp-tRNA(Asn)/Glu-tRNA(Gln) amidotransferase subunit GatA [Candidatus Pelethousia sp.]